MSGSGTEVPPGTGTGGQGTEVPPGTGGQGTEVVEQQIGIEGQQGTEQQSLTAKADTMEGLVLDISNQFSSALALYDNLKKENLGLKESLKNYSAQVTRHEHLLKKKEDELSTTLKKLVENGEIFTALSKMDDVTLKKF